MSQTKSFRNSLHRAKLHIELAKNLEPLGRVTDERLEGLLTRMVKALDDIIRTVDKVWVDYKGERL